jgi:lysozyme family protein
MKTIDEMLEVILKHEGGFVHDLDDSGGATNYGITIGTYSTWLGREATVEEVKNMKREDAIAIYKDQYYYEPKIDWVPHPAQIQVFDIGVNSGPNRAIKMAQHVVNLAGVVGPITEDGAMGPNTKKAIEKTQEKMGNHYNNALVEERLRFYQGIVDRKPSQEKFLKGWTKRAKSFLLPTE